MVKVHLQRIEKDDPIYSKGHSSHRRTQNRAREVEQPTPTPTDGQSMNNLTMPTEQSED